MVTPEYLPPKTQNLIDLIIGLTDDTSKLTKKVKVRKLVIKRNFYDPDTILRHEEKERLTSLAQREFLIKSCGFVETVILCAIS